MPGDSEYEEESEKANNQRDTVSQNSSFLKRRGRRSLTTSRQLPHHNEKSRWSENILFDMEDSTSTPSSVLRHGSTSLGENIHLQCISRREEYNQFQFSTKLRNQTLKKIKLSIMKASLFQFETQIFFIQNQIF